MIYMVFASIRGARGVIRGERWLEEHVDAGDHSRGSPVARAEVLFDGDWLGVQFAGTGGPPLALKGMCCESCRTQKGRSTCDRKAWRSYNSLSLHRFTFAMHGTRPLRSKRLCRVEKQSGVPGVWWHRSRFSWVVSYKKEGRWTSRFFSMRAFLKRSEASAEKAALKAAKEFRRDLVERGVLKEVKLDEKFSSKVVGVTWSREWKRWRVRLSVRDQGTRRWIWGGYFSTKALAEAKARDLAKANGLKQCVKSVGRFKDLPIFKSAYPGVTWNAVEPWRTCSAETTSIYYILLQKL